MICAEVCDAQEPSGSTFCGREIDLSTSPTAHARDRLCNGVSVTDLGYNIYSSTRRLYEHRMVPVEVCDDQEQAPSTLDRREVDLTAC